MSKSTQKGKMAMKVAIYLLLFTWIVLLALLIGIYMLRLQGYENFTAWKNRNQAEETLQPNVVTPVPTSTPVPTEPPAPTEEPASTTVPAPTEEPRPTVAPTNTPVPSNTSVPTSTPTPIPTPVSEETFSGNMAVDCLIQMQADAFFEDGEELCYTVYENGIYFSIVFQKEGTLLPLVYDLTTEEQVTGSGMMKEIYFAIIKERLQSYVKETFPEAAESEFVSYEQTYEPEDYEQFYMTESELIFYFDANVLADGQPAFSYAADLTEAKAFFYKDVEGKVMGHAIRELDPEAKMIALTFDDGPHTKVEDKIYAMLEENDARATFFFLGQRINDWYPKSPGQAYQAGHEVASHTYSHTKDFSRVTAEELWTEINQTNLLIAKSAGYAPDYIRFPGGTDGKRTKEVPMIVVNWTLDSIDYREKNKEDGAEIIYERMINSKHLQDGSIVLLHSIYENSYEAAAMFVSYLKEQGYELVTLSELFYYKYQGEGMETGIKYYDGFGATTAPKK